MVTFVGSDWELCPENPAMRRAAAFSCYVTTELRSGVKMESLQEVAIWILCVCGSCVVAFGGEVEYRS